MPMHAPVHPGRLLKSAIEDLDLSVAEAAKALGVSRMQVHRIVKGQSAISADMAIRLEAVVGSTADAWLRMQAAYDLARIRGGDADPAKALKRIYAAQ